jgi:hypothetical protein
MTTSKPAFRFGLEFKSPVELIGAGFQETT